MNRSNVVAATDDHRPNGFSGDWSYPLHMSGAATALPPAYAEPRDFGAELRAVFTEITGEEVPEPARRRIGFLP